MGETKIIADPLPNLRERLCALAGCHHRPICTGYQDSNIRCRAISRLETEIREAIPSGCSNCDTQRLRGFFNQVRRLSQVMKAGCKDCEARNDGDCERCPVWQLENAVLSVETERKFGNWVENCKEDGNASRPEVWEGKSGEKAGCS